MGKSMSKFLASAGLLIPCLSRENPTSSVIQIWAEITKALYLMILCKAFFKFNPFTMISTIDEKGNYSQFPPKKCPRPICPKIMQPCIS